MKTGNDNPGRSRIPVIGITCGDAAGIGPEVITKALRSETTHTRASFVVYAREAAFRPYVGSSTEWTRLEKIPPGQAAKPGVSIYDPLEGEPPEIVPGRMSPDLADDAMRLVKAASTDALKGRIDAVVTAPINKIGVHAAGYKEHGHTEFIASIAGVMEYAMMFVGGPLKVVLQTIHVPLRDVPALIDRDKVLKTIRLTHRSMRQWFGLDAPRIAVCGINPHAGEEGVMGNEDRDHVTPAVKEAASEGIDVKGPFPADTVFGRCARGDFDVVIAMYHDQGLIPVKSLAFGKGVNVTLGLPFIRTSPDHGTAYDIAGQDKADQGSMIEAVRLAVALAPRRKAQDTPDASV